MDSDSRLQKLSFAGVLVILGIIFGDIGTSPLYVFKAIVGDRQITKQLVLGGISCVFWTLTLQTTFKYVLLTLRADNNGEGGIFSLYALIKRYGKKAYIPAIVGAACLLADGIITPPISVASAVEGLAGVKGLEATFVAGSNLTIGIVLLILTLLFAFQRFGTKVVGSTFGPIMIVWFTMLFTLGIIHITQYPYVLLCLNPLYAIDLLVNYPQGFWLLGAVFLCTTGAEALYSDLGHCGRVNIQFSWIFVKTALVVNYMGQGAWILSSGLEKLNGVNPFYALIPEWFMLIGVVIATLATIIASQALISGSFTLISEAISMNFYPKVAIKFPTDIKGQIYIPSLNLILWLGCVAMMLYFRESSHMEAAYGFSIVLAMLMTTSLMYFYLLYYNKWNKWFVYVVMVIFLTVELAYFVANVVKIKERWMFLIFEVLLVFIMFIWYRARKVTNHYLGFVELDKFIPALVDLSKDNTIPHFATHLVYLTKSNQTTSIEKRIIDSILDAKPKRADIYWFVHVKTTNEPYTMEYDVKELVDDKIIRVDFRLGFRVQPRINLFFKRVMQEMAERNELMRSSKYESLRKYDFNTDITYVIIERVLSVENELPTQDDFILDTYFMLKKYAQSDQVAFGLDHADTVVEQVPLVVTSTPVPLRRVKI